MRLVGWEVVFFYALGAWALAASVAVVAARNVVHSALALTSTLVTVAGLFVLLQAELVAGVQILVYVGGVMVLFLFVIMLVRRDPETTRRTTRQTPIALAAAAVLLIAFLAASASWWRAFDPAVGARPEYLSEGRISRDTEQVALDLYKRAALPFEIASLVLLVAIVGSISLVRGREREEDGAS